MIRLFGLVPQFKPLREFYEGEDDGAEAPNEFESERDLVKSQLLSIQKQTSELYNMLGEADQIEGWAEEKIKICAEYISSVYNHIQYEKNGPKSLGSGDGSPAEAPGAPSGNGIR